jgi:hypothetical protein
MAAFSKQSRVITSISAGRPRATQSSRCEAGSTPAAAGAAEDARRSADGSIDVEFYKARARAIRGATIARLAEALKQTTRTVLARACAVILAKRRKE